MGTQIQLALKAEQSKVRAYVKHLESENRKLQSKILKLESQHSTDKNGIAVLEKELKQGLRVQIVRFAGKT